MADLKTLSTIDTSPFKRLVLNLGATPTAFTEGMTYYELLAWLVDFLGKEVIPKTNENIEAVKELQTYVSTYFDNLDVQEEINNKLDQMAEDGQLEEIIISYLQLKSIMIYDTLDEVISESAFNDNSYVKTLGSHSKGDTGAAIWQIKSSIPADKIGISLNNGKYAVLESKTLYLAYLSLTNFDDINSLNLTDVEEIVLDKNYNITAGVTLSNIVLNLNTYKLIMDGQNHDNLICSDNTTVKNGYVEIVDLVNLNENSGKCIKITGNNNIIDGINFKGWFSVYATTSIDNLEVKNCLLNSYRHEILLHTGIFTNINIHDNKQTVAQDYNTPVQHHNCIQIFNGFPWPYVANSISHETLTNNHGSNIIIKNNNFFTINTRAINLLNATNSEIAYNKCVNPFGDKTGGSLVGYSDDVFVLDLCKYSDIHNNIVENSGENGIDALSCKYVNIHDNKLIGVDADGVDVSESDARAEGATDSTVTNDDLISEHINVNNNEIVTVKTGVRCGGRYINANGNTIQIHPNHTDQTSFVLSAPSSLYTIGNYGTLNLRGNATDENMNLGINGINAATLMKNKDSDLLLDESSCLNHIFDVDNSSLASDSTTADFAWQHSAKFRGIKMFFRSSADNPWFELPQNNYDNYGVVNVSLPNNVVVFRVFKHFVNYTPNANTNSLRNLTAGQIKVCLM